MNKRQLENRKAVTHGLCLQMDAAELVHAFSHATEALHEFRLALDGLYESAMDEESVEAEMSDFKPYLL
ncbi:MAG: hypothetical protein EON87_16095 [Brevundimonas sp.]|nr:MAG: hypothetical protein EON87_16095 [Brevundimonas sp.]